MSLVAANIAAHLDRRKRHAKLLDGSYIFLFRVQDDDETVLKAGG